MSIKITLLGLLILLAFGGPVVSAQTAPTITKDELDTHFEIARSLAGEKKFEQALKEYLFVFDNSRNVSSYGGVRLSYVPAEIALMGHVYPPAKVALQSRRDEREKLVFAGKADFDIVHELTSLNEHLDEPERNLTLFDKLKTLGPAYAELRDEVIMLIWEQLVEAKRYDDLKDKVDELTKRVASQIAESAINKDFPDNSALGSPEYQVYLRHSIIENGGRVYETLLAIGKAETAAKLAKWMFTFSSDGEMYAQLINSAINAKRTDIASDFFERANKTLKRAEDLRLVQEAARRLPKVK